MVHEDETDGPRKEPADNEQSTLDSFTAELFSDAPAPTRNAETYGATNKTERSHPVGPFFKAVFSFLDKHSGAITALATVAIVVLTCFYVRYSKRQWQIMVRQLETSQRPWLSKQGTPELKIQILQGNTVSGTLDFPVKNFGPSPALDIGVGAYPWVRHGGDNSDFIQAREEACKWADTNVMTIGDSLFPQQIKKYSAIVLSPVEHIDKVPTILVSGCIAYRDQLTRCTPPITLLSAPWVPWRILTLFTIAVSTTWPTKSPVTAVTKIAKPKILTPSQLQDFLTN